MTDEDILAQAHADMDKAVDGDFDNREEALDDLENLAGWGQWDVEERQQREADGRPCITINRLTQFVRQVTGDIRRLNPAIKVVAADNEASPDVAEIIAGMVRQIEYSSDASSVYEAAAESAAQCSMGYFRVLSEYESDYSFDQEIKIKRIPNPFAVYFDPDAREPTRSDARFAFVTETVDGKEFKRLYPDAAVNDAKHDAATDGMQHWRSGDDVIVAEYFWKEPVTKTIYMLSDGRVTEDKAAKPFAVRSRLCDTYKVMWAKITGTEVLEGPREFPSMHIPVVAVIGEEMHVGDRVVRTSVIRYAKDPQRLYNYWSSAQTELIALQPKAPYLVTANQVKNFEEFWLDANNSNRAYLPYNSDENAPPPMRATPPIPSAGMMQEIAKAVDDMKATTGIYDAGLGNRSNEQSGIAIRQRQMESDISTSIYTDNLAKAIEQCGRIVVDMIPKIYDTARMVRILGEDAQESLVPVNAQQIDPTQGAVVPINPLTVGRYDVRVTVGPNYSTRRQETQEGMMQFIQSFPQAAQLAGDLIVKAMDWPDADKLADRLRKTLPPGIIDPKDMTPEEQQAMQQGPSPQQQQAMAMQQASMEADVRKAVAGADKAEADAMQARFDAMMSQFELALARLQAPMLPMQQMPPAMGQPPMMGQPLA